MKLKNLALGQIGIPEAYCVCVKDQDGYWSGPDSFAAALAENRRPRLVQVQVQAMSSTGTGLEGTQAPTPTPISSK